MLPTVYRLWYTKVTGKAAPPLHIAAAHGAPAALVAILDDAPILPDEDMPADAADEGEDAAAPPPTDDAVDETTTVKKQKRTTARTKTEA